MNEQVIKFQSGMLRAFCKAFGIEPSVEGLIRGMKGDPEAVFALVKWVQENGQTITQEFELAVRVTADRVAKIEAEQYRQALIQVQMNDMLCALCEKAGIEHSGYLPDPAPPLAIAAPRADATQ